MVKKNRGVVDPGYDLFEDWDLIYLRLRSSMESESIPKSLRKCNGTSSSAACGIGPDTSLGRIVSIRLEDDNEVIKEFTPEQKEIRKQVEKKSR